MINIKFRISSEFTSRCHGDWDSGGIQVKFQFEAWAVSSWMFISTLIDEKVIYKAMIVQLVPRIMINSVIYTWGSTKIQSNKHLGMPYKVLCKLAFDLSSHIISLLSYPSTFSFRYTFFSCWSLNSLNMLLPQGEHSFLRYLRVIEVCSNTLARPSPNTLFYAISIPCSFSSYEFLTGILLYANYYYYICNSF